ncbi:hypothetical protein CEXT_443611 [Caerostris extrusa]|uniref:Uncharacterized protein n=1 Tax=Caerostris extrusa TaxID=172846 RepID=A0AAV4SBP4_CAEEX|nr:hypothetical protein CEXT_443611 [Caerostris extrusa]
MGGRQFHYRGFSYRAFAKTLTSRLSQRADEHAEIVANTTDGTFRSGQGSESLFQVEADNSIAVDPLTAYLQNTDKPSFTQKKTDTQRRLLAIPRTARFTVDNEGFSRE